MSIDQQALPPMNQRIQQLIDEFAKGNVAEFVRMTNISSHQVLNRIFKLDSRTGKFPQPSAAILTSIKINLPQVNYDWLITGEGDMLKTVKHQEAVHISNPNILEVPLVSKYAYAGYMGGYGDDEYVDTLPIIPFYIPENQYAKGEYVAFEVKGDSMDDGSFESLLEGDIVLCRRINQNLWVNSKLHMRKWNFVIVTTEGVLIKRVVNHNVENCTVTVHSLNDFYPDQVIDLKEVRQIFNVVQLMRKPIM